MEREDMISAIDFCNYHHVSFTLIDSLCDAGLVEVTIIEDHHYLHQDQMRDLERLVRMHTDLEINTAGIEAIAHLLERMDTMQQELRLVQQRLQVYESLD